MVNKVFVDTSAWVALANLDDAHHGTASFLYPDLLKHHGGLITSNLVVAEAYFLMRRKLGLRPALMFLQTIRASLRIEKVYSTKELEEQAGETLRRYSDQDFSFTDAVSFALMAQRRIDLAFTFDRHFSSAGFTMVPARR